MALTSFAKLLYANSDQRLAQGKMAYSGLEKKQTRVPEDGQPAAARASTRERTRSRSSPA
jgi:hypothetical protein